MLGFPVFFDLLQRLRCVILRERLGLSLKRQPGVSESGLLYLDRLPIQHLDIELTNICNANCIFCGYQYQQRPHAVMENDLFENAVRQFRDMGGKRLTISPLVGENLVDRDCLRKLEFSGKMQFDSVTFFTNGILLERTDIRRLLQSGVTTICISTSGFDKEEYERLFRNRAYDKMIRGVGELLNLNRELGNPVNISILVRSDMAVGVSLRRHDFLELIKPYLCSVKTEAGTRSVSINHIMYYDSWGKMIKRQDLPPGMRIGRSYRDKRVPCHGSLNLKLLHDGKVEVCGCRFSTNGPADDLYVGDLNSQSLEEIWSSGRVKEFRRRFVSNDINFICSDCYYYYPVDLFYRDICMQIRG